MPRINCLTIDGFKSIWSEKVELGQLNVFIGNNGAGKSNFLEAIAMLSASLEGGVDYERLSRRGSRLSTPEIFRSAFKNKDRRSTLRLAAKMGALEYNLNLNATDGFSYFSESIKSGDETLAGRSNNGATIRGRSFSARLDSKRSIFPYLEALSARVDSDSEDEEEVSVVDSLSRLVDFAIYAPATPILRGISADLSNKSPLGLYGGRLAEAFKEVLSNSEARADMTRIFRLMGWMKSVGSSDAIDNKLISEHINLGRLNLLFQDNFMKTNFNKLYAYDVSEGVLYVLFVLVLLTHHDAPDIFALDNIDTALNPGLVRDLISHISQILASHPEKQVFLTTHNPSTLDSIDLFNGDHRLFVVDRDQSGHTRLTRIQPPKDMTREGWEQKYFGMKLSEIWLSGAIGGMPSGF